MTPDSLTLHETFILKAFLCFVFSTGLYHHPIDAAQWSTGFWKQFMPDIQGELARRTTSALCRAWDLQGSGHKGQAP